MTLLATLFNLGTIWPSTSALYLIGFFTFKVCVDDPIELHLAKGQSTSKSGVNNFLHDNKCSTPALSEVTFKTLVFESLKEFRAQNFPIKVCKLPGGTCVTQIDAYYILSGVMVAVGVVWLALFYRMIKRISHRDKNDWKLMINYK
jgi:hypothetical protein